MPESTSKVPIKASYANIQQMANIYLSLLSKKIKTFIDYIQKDNTVKKLNER